MALTPFPWLDFGKGLNLRDRADVVTEAEAIDLLNVDFGIRGSVRQRDGFTAFTGTAMTNAGESLFPFYTAAGTKYLIVGAGTRLEALDSNGAVAASATGLTGGPWSFAGYASAGSEAVYAGNGSDTLRKFSAGAWTTPTATVDGVAARAMPKAGALCVHPTSQGGGERLLATAFGTGTTSGPNAAATNPSRVYFSEPGDPQAWLTTNWVDVEPGDGESIVAAVCEGNQSFVFKGSKFAVFYGESLDVTGNPLFLGRVVNTGVGLAAAKAIVVTHRGIFFMGRDGVYVTAGGDPQLISDVVSPIWSGDAEVYYSGGTLNHAQIDKCRMAFHNERLYLAFPSGSSTVNNRVLVYDLQRQWWSLYDLPAAALMPFRSGDTAELHFAYSTGANKVGKLTFGQPDDDGTAISSFWRSGWWDLGHPTEKRIPRVEYWGDGACRVDVSKNFEQTFRSGTSVVFANDGDTWGDGTGSDTWGDGTNPLDTWRGGAQITRQLVTNAINATVVSVKFTADPASSSWSVHRASRHLASVRAAGLHSQ